jgi:AraC-like DNA-binding protein
MANIYFFLIFFTAVLGFIVAGILLFRNQAESFSARLLAAFIVTFSLFALHYTLLTVDGLRKVPHMWRVFVWISFLYMPISYVYVRSVLRQSFRFEKWDFLLLLPAIIYTASFIPFYVKSAAEKLAFMDQMKLHPELLTAEPESAFPLRTGFLLRLLLGIGCVLGQYYHLFKWKQVSQGNVREDLQNRGMYRWLYSFTTMLGIFYVLVAIQFFMQVQLGKGNNIVMISSIVITILFVSMSLLFKPSILYGMCGWAPSVKPEATEAVFPEQAIHSDIAEPKKSYLTAEQGETMKTVLEEHFQKNKPFLKPGYSVSDLSHELSIQSYQLSGFINQAYTKNFNELINEYRVQHLVKHYPDNEAASQYTLEAIGREVGFNSRAAFIAAVRKVTGKTPSEILGRRSRDSKEALKN